MKNKIKDRGFAIVILQKLSNVFACPPCGKNCFFPKHSETQYLIKKIFKNPGYNTSVFFKCLQSSAKYTGWTDYRVCCTAIVLTLHRWNILIIFKQLSVLPFLQEDFTEFFAYFQFWGFKIQYSHIKNGIINESRIR